MERRIKTLPVHIGKSLIIGGDAPIVVQTMCNTHTSDVDGTVRQCLELAEAGAQMVRITVPGMQDVPHIAEIHRRLRESGCEVPLVADIHFSSRTAIAVASIVEKVRINPGNFHPDHEEAKKQFRHLISVCKDHGTAIRIGLNHGSLGTYITDLYGNTPHAMAIAAMEWIRMCTDEDFFNVVVSLKASNTLVMTEAYRELVTMMQESGTVFPLHLGVTESGNGDSGRIKSCIGIATLLQEGIGDTLRVSLTEPPVAEIPVARYLAQHGPSADGNTDPMLDAAIKWGPKLLKTEYLACPGCGHTMYDLQGTFEKVKERTSHLKGVVIAVMGCIVNGPGEMADADWGYVGEGAGFVSIYKKGQPVLRHIPDYEAIDKLVELISQDN